MTANIDTSHLDTQGLNWFNERYEYVSEMIKNGEGIDDEYFVEFLAHIATITELEFLAVHRLSIYQLLHGQYGNNFDPTEFYQAWNERSGLNLFDLQ